MGPSGFTSHPEEGVLRILIAVKESIALSGFETAKFWVQRQAHSPLHHQGNSVPGLLQAWTINCTVQLKKLMIIFGEMVSKWKPGVVNYIKVLFRHLFGRTEENGENTDTIADAPSEIRSRYLKTVTSWLDCLCASAMVSNIQVLWTIFVSENFEENTIKYKAVETRTRPPGPFPWDSKPIWPFQMWSSDILLPLGSFTVCCLGKCYVIHSQ
jgi:hypothetical protein